MNGKVMAIVPVREFRDSKLRLRGYISNNERSALSKELFKHVIRELLHSKIKKTLVVASDESEISAVVPQNSNVLVIGERNHHGGVNAAAEDGVSYCRARLKEMTSIMVIPSDLPLLSARAINNAISKLSTYDLIVGPSSKLDGTSLLLFNIGEGKIPFHYDNNSYRNHVKEARRFKIKYTVIKSKEFSWDVDTKDDLTKLKSKMKAGSFRELLLKLST